MVRCENCGKRYDHADELEHEEVEALSLVEDGEGPPKIQIGTGLRDVWRCKGCGKVLGVS